jgi:hypothetical protein
MTEMEWLTCDDPIEMLGAVAGELRRRKFRLFACACCRRLWHLLAEESRRTIQVTERYADGDATANDLFRACLGADDAASRSGGVNRVVYRLALSDDQFDVYEVTDHAAEWLGGMSDVPSPEEVAERIAQIQIGREVFGNPFREPTIAPSWLAWNDGTVTKLAHAGYDGGDLPSGHLNPARLAVLSDALEEAGCTDAAILSHLRSPGPHIRGCWVLDLILGK